jgi:hypothetical protein
MDSVNTAIRGPYLTLPCNGRVPKICKQKRRKYTSLQIYKGADILRKMRSDDAIKHCKKIDVRLRAFYSRAVIP